MITKLDWDSDFFNREIGRLDLGDKELFTFDISNSSFESVYVFANGPISELEKDENVFRDVKVTFKKPANKVKARTINLIRPFYSEQLKDLFFQSGSHSRFKLDPILNPNFQALYTRWMENALNGTFDNMIYATGFPEAPTSCLTLKTEPEALRIGIIAVDESARGKGIGTGLIDYASSKAHEFGYDSLIVSTQERNKQAMRFYEKQGFTIWKKEYIYHIHKDV